MSHTFRCDLSSSIQLNGGETMTENERADRIRGAVETYLKAHDNADPWSEKKCKRKKNFYRVKRQEVGGDYFEKRRSWKRRER